MSAYKANKRGKTHPNEERYRLLFENMLNGVAYCRMIFDQGRPQDFIYLAVNKAFEAQTGLRAVVGKRAAEVVPGIGEADPTLLATLGRVVTTGIPAKFEVYMAGLRMWFAISAYRPEAGCFVTVFDVITQQKQTEESLNLFRNLVDQSKDAFEVIDPETGRFLDVNERGCLDLGYRRAELLALHVADIDPMVNPADFTKLVEKVEKDGALTWKSVHRRKDGSTFPVEVGIKYVRLDRDYLVTVARDISEQQHAAESQARLVTAIEQVAETIVITDTKGTMLYVNPAFEKITGYTRQEALGQNPRILKSDKQNTEFYRQMWAALTAGQVWSGHLINRRKDGTLYEEDATISPILDTAGGIINYVAVKRDVTHEVALEAQNRQAAKMEAVGQLAGGVAHDFNNKLQVILGSVEVILQDLPPDHPIHADLREIQNAARRSADLTRQLLAFSRKQSIEPVLLDMNAEISGSLKMLRRLVGENIHLNFEPAPNEMHVFMDPSQLDQLLANLVVNARDAITGTGHIFIGIAPRALQEADCQDRPDFVTPGDYAVLTISDDGAGIPPEIQEHIFEPFFTTKGQGKGTGLGLATVYGIAKQNHGAIAVQSTPGQGATFSVYLPRIQGGGLAAAPAANEQIPTGAETILVGTSGNSEMKS